MFTPFTLRGMTVVNRVVVAPMDMYCAVDGTPGDFHLVHLGTRALGGAGLVITEMTCVSPEARITPGCTGMYAPEHVAAWRRIVDFVHAAQRRADLPAARPRRTEGFDQGALGRQRRPARRDSWQAVGAVGGALRAAGCRRRGK